VARLGFACLPLLCLASASGLRAEEVGVIAPGARVRVTAPVVGSKPLLGAIATVTEETLDLRVKRQEPVVSVRRADIVRLQVSRGRARRKAALIGGSIGAAALLGVTYFDCTQWSADGCDPAASVAASAGIGFAVGAAVGALVAPERWQEIPADRSRVALVLARGKRAAVTVAFR
jgi:hypothetical protein